MVLGQEVGVMLPCIIMILVKEKLSTLVAVHLQLEVLLTELINLKTLVITNIKKGVDKLLLF